MEILLSMDGALSIEFHIFDNSLRMDMVYMFLLIMYFFIELIILDSYMYQSIQRLEYK